MSQKDLLLDQTHLAYSGDPEMSLKASLEGITQEIASRELCPESWTIEEMVFHVASAKIEYCKQGFGQWTGGYDKPLGDIEQIIRLLDRAQKHLVDCLESCSEKDLSRPIATRFHGESAAHFFSIMIIHDIAHAAQIRTRQRAFGVRAGDYYPV